MNTYCDQSRPNELTDETFGADTKQGIHIIVFYTAMCSACGPVKQSLSDLIKDFPGVTFHQMSADTNPYIAKEHGIRAVPSILVIQDGEVMDKFTGLHEGSLRDCLSNLIKEKAA